MRLSPLQKYILKELYGARGKYQRNRLKMFYARQKRPARGVDQQHTITKSIERLIDKELLIGFGKRTPHKWFINEIALTAKGRRIARVSFGQQQTLPFLSRKSST
ncbi:MAG: hypothetical protein WC289_04190 [Patescibacteria group bacterium]|jgi:hypothetical protein